MFNFTNDYASLNYISKIKTDSIQKKITYYLNGKIESQVFANSTAYNNAISKIEDTNFILLGDTYYNLKYISIVKQNGKNVTYIFTGKDVVDFAYGTVKAAEDVIALLKDSFLEIEGKWYNAEQLVVANSNEDSLIVTYNFGGEQLNVQYANSTDFEDAVEKVEEVNGSGSGDVDIENNKAATIDVSEYTDPVVVTPSKGKDGMKKATVTLSNIPGGGGVYYLYTAQDETLIVEEPLSADGGTLTGTYIDNVTGTPTTKEYKNATYSWAEGECQSICLFIGNDSTKISPKSPDPIVAPDYTVIYLGNEPDTSEVSPEPENH